MRWWLLPIAAALGWFVFTLSPLWSLYELAAAVQGGDADYVAHHVNFRTLRLSLTRQITAAIKAGSAEADPRDRQRLNDAAAALSLPLVEALVTPRTVIDLLDDGWPQSLPIAEPAPEPSALAGLRIGQASRLVGYYAASQMRGFRTVVVRLPPDRPPARQFDIRLRLRGWSWRLIDIELTDDLKARVAAKVAQAHRSRNREPRADETVEPDRNNGDAAQSTPR